MTTAVAMDTGERTLLLECDLETHSDEVLGVPGGPGLVSGWTATISADKSACPPSSNAFVIPAAASDLTPREVFYKLSQGDTLGELQSEFPNIIIDLPRGFERLLQSAGCQDRTEILHSGPFMAPR